MLSFNRGEKKVLSGNQSTNASALVVAEKLINDETISAHGYDYELRLGNSYLILSITWFFTNRVSNNQRKETHFLLWDISRKQFVAKMNIHSFDFASIPYDNQHFLVFDENKESKKNLHYRKMYLWSVDQPNSPLKDVDLWDCYVNVKPYVALLKDKHHFLQIRNQCLPYKRSFVSLSLINFGSNVPIREYNTNPDFFPTTMHVLPDSTHFIAGLISELDFSSNDIVSKNKKLCLWNIDQPNPIGYFNIPDSDHNAYITEIVYLEKRKQILVVNGNRIYLWNASGGYPIAQFNCPQPGDDFLGHIGRGLTVLPGEQFFTAHYAYSGIWLWTLPESSKDLITTQECGIDSTLEPQLLAGGDHVCGKTFTVTFMDKSGSLFYAKSRWEKNEIVEVLRINQNGLSFSDKSKNLFLSPSLDKECRPKNTIQYLLKNAYETITGLFQSGLRVDSTKSSDAFLGTKIPSHMLPDVKYATPSQTLELPSPADNHQQKEEKVIGHGTEHSTFLQPLSFNDKLTVAQYCLSYVNQFFPWNKKQKLTAKLRLCLEEQAKELIKLEKQFNDKKESRSYRLGVHGDLFKDTEYAINKTKLLVTHALNSGSISTSEMSSINKYISQIINWIPKLIDNKKARAIRQEIRKIKKQERRHPRQVKTKSYLEGVSLFSNMTIQQPLVDYHQGTATALGVHRVKELKG